MSVPDIISPGARTLRPGTRLGRYVLLRRIARGGMAEVYLAHARGIEGFERILALKLVLPHLTEDERFISMFLNEARVAAKLDHPNIAHVHDLGCYDGEYLLAMEYVHGENVRDILKRSAESTPLPLECALTICLRACAGLHHAHERRGKSGKPLGIIHRDVSPSNILVRYDGGVKIVDFGIAKATLQTSATRTGTFKGKAGYMSPEQCRDERVDRRSDVFGLGILLYETTTGRRLFYGDNEFAIINKIAKATFDRPREVDEDYPEELERIVMQALASDPAERTPSARALQLQLEVFARENRIAVSEARLADAMQALFGDVPYPAADPDIVGKDEPEEQAPEPTRIYVPKTGELAKPPRPWGRRAMLLGVAAAAGAGAIWLGGRSNEDVQPPKPQPKPDQPEVSPQPTPVEAEPAQEPAAPEPAPVAAPEPAAPEPAATEKEPKPKGRRRSRRRKRRQSATKPSEPASTKKKDRSVDLDSMYPGKRP